MIAENYLSDSIKLFANYKKLAERAMEQVDDKAFFFEPDEISNSIAVIVKHMAGNMRSRWRDFLTSDGEKPDRDRDDEFILTEKDTRENLMAEWENGWQYLFDALKPLTPSDAGKIVLIRDEKHTVVEAINRQLTHYAYHVGQIAYLARLRAASWKSLSIPKGESKKFNSKMMGGPGKSGDDK